MSATKNSSKLQAGSIRNLQLFWVRRTWLDVGIGITVALVWVTLGWKSFIPMALEDVAAPQRQAFYQIVATISGTMAGFTLTSVSVLVNLMRTPLAKIDNLLSSGEKLRVGDVVLKVLPTLSLLFVMALVGVLGDSTVGMGHQWIQFMVIGLLVASILALARVIWVLRRLLVVTNQ